MDNIENKAPAPQTLGTKVMTSEVLFAGERELVIQHGANEYRLRLTNQDKLILTK